MSDIEELIDLIERLEASDELSLSEDKIITSLNNLIKSCHVPRIEHSEDVPYTEKDFESFVKSAEVQLVYISRYFSSICSASDKGRSFSSIFKKNAVINSLLLASEYTDPNSAWSNDKLAKEAEILIKRICHLCQVDIVSKILISDDMSNNISENVSTEGYLNSLLQNFSTEFNKKNWKKYPAKANSYHWILTVLDYHSMGNSLSYLLPPALFILDDWEQKNKILGLKCLTLILKSVSGSELRWFGRAAVINDAIKPIMFRREPDILELFYPLCLNVIKALDTDPANVDKFKKVSMYDPIIQQLLREMAHEQKIDLRKVYIQTLNLVITYMDIYTLRWSDEILEVCQDYIATYDGPKAEDRITAVKVLQTYIRHCWPQVHVNANKILKIVVRLLYDVTLDDSNVNKESVEELVSEVKILVNLLQIAAPDTTHDLCRGLETVQVHPAAKAYIAQIKAIATP